ncbi:MAG: dephospho-CoA kinase [Nevskiales bacterium]
MSLVIGLTGGIASGKSAAAEHFASLGVPVLDADQVSRQVVVPGSTGLAQLVQHFGEDILDTGGNLDRRRMRERVFSNDSARRELEAILHPLIRRNMLTWRDNCTAAYCILMVPLLVKLGWSDLADRLLVIDVDEAQQMSRLQARDDIDQTLAESMINAQDSRQARQQAADDLILNNGSLEDLQAMVAECHRIYSEFAEKNPGDLPALRLRAT